MAMDVTVVNSAQGHRELVADLETHRAELRDVSFLSYIQYPAPEACRTPAGVAQFTSICKYKDKLGSFCKKHHVQS
jgi:hypothetical protein